MTGDEKEFSEEFWCWKNCFRVGFFAGVFVPSDQGMAQLWLLLWQLSPSTIAAKFCCEEKQKIHVCQFILPQFLLLEMSPAANLKSETIKKSLKGIQKGDKSLLITRHPTVVHEASSNFPSQIVFRAFCLADVIKRTWSWTDCSRQNIIQGRQIQRPCRTSGSDALLIPEFTPLWVPLRKRRVMELEASGENPSVRDCDEYGNQSIRNCAGECGKSICVFYNPMAHEDWYKSKCKCRLFPKRNKPTNARGKYAYKEAKGQFQHNTRHRKRRKSKKSCGGKQISR